MLRFLVRLAGTETPAPSLPLGHDLYNPAIVSEDTVRHPVLHDNDEGYFWCLCLRGPRHLRKRLRIKGGGGGGDNVMSKVVVYKRIYKSV